MEALERRKQKPDDSAKESSSRKAETIRDVKGDGNCFFRCISVFFNGDEDKHEDIRRKVVETLRENKDCYKHLVDGDFDTHIQNMSKATGSRNSRTTEAELCATSETYDCEIYVFAKAGTVEKWHRYSVWETCNHRSQFIKINHTGSHYQLLVDSERPCSCGEHKGERQSVRLRDRKANELESNINEHLSILQQEEQSLRNGEYGPISEPTEDLTWNGRQGKEFENLINSMYEEIIYLKIYNIFEPSQSNTLGQLVKEMTNLITHYNVDAPINKLALKIIMIMPSLLLQKLHPKAKAQENNKAFKRRMKLWADGKFEELMSEDKAIQKRLDNNQHKQRGETDKARLFRLKMEHGQIRQAARLLEHEESGGLVLLNEEILRKLKEKHPGRARATAEALLQREREKTITPSGLQKNNRGNG